MGFSAWWSRLSALPVLHSSCSCLALFSYVFVCDRVSHVAVLVLNLQSYLRVAPHPSKPARPVSRLTLWFLETFDDTVSTTWTSFPHLQQSLLQDGFSVTPVTQHWW